MRLPSIAWGLALALLPRHEPTRSASPARAARLAHVRVDRVADAAPLAAAAEVPTPSASAFARSSVQRAHVNAPARVVERGLCSALLRPDEDGRFLTRSDVTTSFSDGASLLTRVDRSAAGALPADWAPSDLVDLRTGAPSTAERCEPPGGQCLRAEAASALARLLGAMRADGLEGHVHSAFRAYRSQCAVFAKWAYREGQGLCRAAEQSALAGHSQHQLGTTLDLFTRAWADAGPVFRAGFGDSPGGRWLAAHAWEYGFVLPYPLYPDRRAAGARDAESVDPRTGYQYEPWHVRYLGDAAARFHDAWLASGPGTPAELAPDQWLRREAGLAGDGALPVCDGCACGACSTLAEPGAPGSPCGARALRLRADGSPVASVEAPSLVEVRLVRVGATLVRVEARVAVAPGTVTQTPVLDAHAPPLSLARGANAWAPREGTDARAYGDLPGAWRLAVEAAGEAPGGARWPVRAGLADASAAAAWNGGTLYLPAEPGARWVRVPVELTAPVRALRVALVRDGDARGAIELEVPPADDAR